jgi:hypothetical protein
LFSALLDPIESRGAMYPITSWTSNKPTRSCRLVETAQGVRLDKNQTKTG